MKDCVVYHVKKRNEEEEEEEGVLLHFGAEKDFDSALHFAICLFCNSHCVFDSVSDWFA